MANVPYDENKYRQGIDTSYYSNAINEYKKQQEANRKQQIGDAAAARDSALRQAYVNKMQSETALNRNLAQQGIRGGATETSNLRIATNYGNQRGAANTDYTSSVNSINRGIDQNISDYTSDMNSRAEEYRQNMAQSRWQAAREDANLKEQYAREDAALKYDRNINEQNRLTDYWSNFYQNYYSGANSKSLKKAEKDIRAKLSKAKTPGERIRWEQALAGIGARRGVIKNK